MKIIVFCPNWVGDAVMATPTLRALRRRFPRAEIAAFVRRPIDRVLECLPSIDRLIVHNRNAAGRWWRGPSSGATLHAEAFDLAVLLTNSFRTAVLAWRARIGQRVGYARDGRSLLLTDALPLGRHGGKSVPRPVIDYYLQLAYYLGCSRESYRLKLATSPQDEKTAGAFWQRKGLTAVDTVVTFNPGGAYGAAKHWPVEYFAELARRLVERPSTAVLVLCGPAEEPAADEIVRRAAQRRVVSLAGEKLDLGFTKACVRRSALMVTTDSGPRHFAAAFDVPVVTLFGPTHIAWSENHYPRAIHLQRDVECGPCQQRVCPYGHHRCMRELLPETVYRAAVELLEREPGTHRIAG